MPPDHRVRAVVFVVLARELRAHRRSFALWVIPIALLIVAVVGLQPSMAGDGGVLAAKLAAMPESMRRAFGMMAIDLQRPAAYLSINFLYVTLTAALSGGLHGAAVIAKEETQRTAELLYSQPVDRLHVVLGKALAVALGAIAFNAALAAVALGALAAILSGPLEPGLVLALFGGTTCLGLASGGLGMLVATVVRRARVAGNVALGLVVGMYLIGLVGAISPAAELLRWLSLFEYVAPARILARGGLHPLAAGGMVTLGVCATAIAISRYRRRDLPS
jgi:ABC-2 type transport system permease protein